MEYNNYSISFKKGQLYLKSKEPKEGYEKVIFGLKDEKVTYHKYAKSIKGILKALEVKEVQFEGMTLSFLEVSFEDDNTLNKVSVALKNTKGNYTDEVKAIVSALNAAEPGQNYTFTVDKKVTNSKGKDYTNLNVYVNYIDRVGDNGKGLSTGFIPYADIPKAEKEEDEDLGTTWNWKPVNKFFAVKIKELTAKLSSNTAPAPTQVQAPKEDKAPAPVSNHMTPDKDNELPF